MAEKANEQPYLPGLDEMMEAPQAAKWLKMSQRQLLAESKGKGAKIPGFWLNRRVVRFHPRTIITSFARDTGLTPDFIAAMFGEPNGFQQKQNNLRKQ